VCVCVCVCVGDIGDDDIDFAVLVNEKSRNIDAYTRVLKLFLLRRITRRLRVFRGSKMNLTITSHSFQTRSLFRGARVAPIIKVGIKTKIQET
jgi:hypothetical protein